MLQAAYCKYRLHFKEAATTSRETMTYKDTYFIKLFDSDTPEVYGIGECALFRGLSADDKPDYEERLDRLCQDINTTHQVTMPEYSSIRFGVETALADLQNGGQHMPYPSPWSQGKTRIVINGLVWMGTIEEMSRRVRQKLEQGFRCIKFKIGGQDFEQELALLRGLRALYPTSQLEIRLDANGAFHPSQALERLNRLAELDVHSIEQPIKARQWDEMAQICATSPIPIALDEELIGIDGIDLKASLLNHINPHYVILKPALCGGISGAKEWIALAEKSGIGWWVTSALESNIGLNMLAQWVSTLSVTMPQGLGTGALYTNNIPSPLTQTGDSLVYDTAKNWGTLQWGQDTL